MIRSDAHVLRAALFATLLACPSLAWAATDVIMLKNGDRITGEVKLVDQGRLRLSTDAAGLIDIQLEEIAQITAQETFAVEDMLGQIYVGALRPDGEGRVAVVASDGSVSVVDIASVVRLQTLGATFWRRINSTIDLGASYTKSSGVGQASLSATVNYRRPSFEMSSRLDSSITVQSKTPQTSRNQLQLNYTKILPHRWLAPGIGQFESNSDLGLALRSTIGGGVGRLLVSRIRHRLLVAGGLAVNREVPLEGEPTANTEAFAAMSHSYVTYNSPKTGLDTQVFLFPSLSDPGRLRLTLDTRVHRELLPSFNVGVSLYDTYDNRPPTATAVTNDVGVSVTAGYRF